MFSICLHDSTVLRFSFNFVLVSKLVARIRTKSAREEMRQNRRKILSDKFNGISISNLH